jgi:UDP-glucuronate decarboxylase
MNIGNPDERTVLELAHIVLQLTGSRSTIGHTQLPEDDPGRRCPDITMARKYLGWEPTISLEEGLCRTADFFRAMGIGPA